MDAGLLIYLTLPSLFPATYLADMSPEGWSSFFSPLLSIFQRRMKRRVKRGTGPPPDPVVVIPSDEYVGHDGPWSTFNVRIGHPPQALKMIASTSSVETTVVDASGCSSHDPKDCIADRGQVFNATMSKTWEDWSNGTRYALDDDRGLPYRANGTFGTDTLNFLGRAHGMDPEGVSIPHHVIARVTSKEQFIGAIGLNPRLLSPQKIREGYTSNLRDMKERGLIPSLAYGYTAGARNRRQGLSSRPAKASLILGGYDAGLRKPNNVNFQMGPEETDRDLSLWVKSINILANSTDTSNQRTTVSSTPFNAIVDSGVSPFFLPPTVCDSFAKYLQLRYNNTLDMYLINETDHNRLEDSSPSMEITISNEAVGGKDVTILLPYASLELRLNREYPNATIWSRYFPIRPAKTPEQYTLGRVFLQEAYLIANYERRNFSIAQRAYDSEKPRIMPIRDPARPASDDVSNAATYGLIAGGCALAGLLILLLVWRCQRRRGKKVDAESGQNSTAGKTELDSTTRTVYELDKGNEVFELTGKPSRVEAINPDMKCAFDDEVELQETIGPFELPANETVEPMSPASDVGIAMPGPSRSGSSGYVSTPATAVDHDEFNLISPIEGTISSGMYTISTFNHNISPVSPTDTTNLVPVVEERRSEIRDVKR